MDYALIGCGRIAANHIKAAVDNRLRISAVCDIKPEAMEQLLARHGLEHAAAVRRYTDYRQMLAENEIQLATIATESGLHAQIALDCIDRGINVIIEKPMAMSMVDAERIIQRSSEKGVKVCASRIVSTPQCRRRAGHWNRAGLGSCPMGLFTSAGTGTVTTTYRPLGVGHGCRMGDA